MENTDSGTANFPLWKWPFLKMYKWCKSSIKSGLHIPFRAKTQMDKDSLSVLNKTAFDVNETNPTVIIFG